MSIIEYIDNYLKTTQSLLQHYTDKPAVNDNGVIVDFNVANVTVSFNFKVKITYQADDSGTKKCWHIDTIEICK